MFPDGGIARLRVYGEARSEAPPPHHIVDLVSLLNGATCQGRSSAESTVFTQLEGSFQSRSGRNALYYETHRSLKI